MLPNKPVPPQKLPNSPTSGAARLVRGKSREVPRVLRSAPDRQVQGTCPLRVEIFGCRGLFRQATEPATSARPTECCRREPEGQLVLQCPRVKPMRLDRQDPAGCE